MTIVSKRHVTSHNVLKRKDGHLVLVFEVLTKEPQKQPVLLVSSVDETAYLRRSPSEVYEISNIAPANIDQLRKVENIVVVEMEGQKAIYSYSAVSSTLENAEDQSSSNVAM